MEKKSQIQIGETITVLLVFFVIVIIGLIFYTKFAKDNLAIEQQEIYEQKSIAIAQRIMFLPELQCSEDNVIRDNCIDVLKLESTYNVLKDPANEIYYFDIFEYSRVNVSLVYPKQDFGNSFVLYSKTLPNYKTKHVTHFPVSIYEPLSRQHAFGILQIETYS